jgi:hypothetical protein
MPLYYKHHIIVAGASRSQTADNFVPVAYIAWELTVGERGRHAMISSERFPTFEDASSAAVEDAKAWVDRHAAELD